MLRPTMIAAALLLLLAAESHAQTRIPVAGVDPARGFCDGVLEVTSRTDGRLDAALSLQFPDRSLRISGPLEPQGGTRWRAEFKVPKSVLQALDRSAGPNDEIGILTLDVDADAGTAKGRYSTGPGGVYFEDRHSQPPVLDQRDTKPLASDDPRTRTAVQVRYYGAAGYHVKRGDDEILFAPFLSAPSFGEVAASEVMKDMKPNLERIDAGLAGTNLGESRAILVGHGHYDHLMDVPPVARKQAPKARIFCNQTSANILAGEPDGAALVGRTEVMDGRLGTWVKLPGTKIRVMALEGDHPDHLMGVQFYVGSVDKPRTTPPRRGNDWKGGKTLVFLVDFLDDQGGVSYRIYYQDASPHSPKGTVPASILAEHRVDLAIYCISLHEHVKGFPQDLTRNLDPRVMLLGHWEDIFSPMAGLGSDRDKKVEDLKLRMVVDTDPREFVRELNTVRSKDSRWIMPLAGSLYHFDPVAKTAARASRSPAPGALGLDSK